MQFRILKLSIISILVFFISLTTTSAQKIAQTYPFDQTKTYKFVLYDEAEFIGKFVSRDTSNITIKTNSIPKIEIPIIKIKTIEELNDANYKYGVYWFPNPNPTRYLFGPSAFNLKKGEGYYQNTMVGLNSFNVGITDNFSIGGGLELFSLIAGYPVFIITPKVGFKVSNNFNAGGGVLYAKAGDAGSLGIVYGLGTIGNVDHNLTGGLGWGFIEDEFSASPVITISGMTRLSKRVALVSENWFITSNGFDGIISYGVRFFGEKMAVDVAFINNPAIARTFVIGIPWVDFVVKFN